MILRFLDTNILLYSISRDPTEAALTVRLPPTRPPARSLPA
jgi:predicted nucleic acid-binding protein